MILIHELWYFIWVNKHGCLHLDELCDRISPTQSSWLSQHLKNSAAGSQGAETQQSPFLAQRQHLIVFRLRAEGEQCKENNAVVVVCYLYLLPARSTIAWVSSSAAAHLYLLVRISNPRKSWLAVYTDRCSVHSDAEPVGMVSGLPCTGLRELEGRE